MPSFQIAFRSPPRSSLQKQPAMIRVGALAIALLIQSFLVRAYPGSNGSTTSNSFETGNSTHSNSSTSSVSRSGFIVEDCGNRTSDLMKTLDGISNIVRPALRDVGLGTFGRHGFEALFKENGTQTVVRYILQEIEEGTPKSGLQPDPGRLERPRFACATQSSLKNHPFLTIDPWKLCQAKGSPVSVYIGDTAYTFICPDFWTIPSSPDGDHCMSLRRNGFQGNGHGTMNFQTYTLIHEMVHFYLGNSSASAITEPPEVYWPNDLVILHPKDSIVNPANYQLYVASKLYLFK